MSDVLTFAELANLHRSIRAAKAEHDDKREFWVHLRAGDTQPWDVIERGPVPFGFRENSHVLPALWGISFAEPFQEGDRFCIYEDTYEWRDGDIRPLRPDGG